MDKNKFKASPSRHELLKLLPDSYIKKAKKNIKNVESDGIYETQIYDMVDSEEVGKLIKKIRKTISKESNTKLSKLIAKDKEYEKRYDKYIKNENSEDRDIEDLFSDNREDIKDILRDFYKYLVVKEMGFKIK